MIQIRPYHRLLCLMSAALVVAGCSTGGDNAQVEPTVTTTTMSSQTTSTTASTPQVVVGGVATSLPSQSTSTTAAAAPFPSIDWGAISSCQQIVKNALEEYANDKAQPGYQFIGDCQYGGWMIGYPTGDKYDWPPEMRGADDVKFVNGLWRELITTENLPNIRHPKYADALTVSDLTPGRVVCLTVGNKKLPPQIVGDLYGVYMTVGYYPFWEEKSNTADPSKNQLWSLEDDGVIPYSGDGSWSVSRLVDCSV